MNYIGSKKSSITFIKDYILLKAGGDIEHKVFADLFAGTGIVGGEFKRLGAKVISNDIQFYSYVLNKHLIQNNSITNINLELINKLNSIEGVKGFIYNHYCEGSGSGRKYFTNLNGMRCDAIRVEIGDMYGKGHISTNEYYFLLGSLLNSIDKYANTASVYGAFLKHTKKSAQKDFILNPLPVIEGKVGEVYNMDANELIMSIQGDILYLDPPYNARQYSSNYHVLETIAKYDNPILRGGVTGLRKEDTQKSNYCSKIKVLNEFEELIKNAKFEHIFLSYNDEGLMSIEDIKNVMSKYGEYDVKTLIYKKFKSQKVDTQKKHTIEYLHYIKKGVKWS